MRALMLTETSEVLLPTMDCQNLEVMRGLIFYVY
jgi:hypothetical protein